MMERRYFYMGSQVVSVYLLYMIYVGITTVRAVSLIDSQPISRSM